MSRCGSELVLSLPGDVLGLVSRHLRPSDLASLSLTCRRLHHALSTSDKVWLPQCLNLLPSPSLLASWRSSASYLALCRFLAAAAPLLGIWVHQNPELGNVVCVTWGTAGPSPSLVACRVIPQELGPHGIDSGPLLWAPVLEILPSSSFDDASSSPLCFFLHGRTAASEDSLYPGSVASIDPSCNVLLLEVDVRGEKAPPLPQFGRLAFGDRRRLLDLVADRVRVRVPSNLETVPLFAANPEEERLMAERRSSMIQMHKVGGRGRVDWRAAEILESMERSRGNSSNGDGHRSSNGKKRSFFSAVKQIIGRSNNNSLSMAAAAALSAGESKHVPLGEFLKAGDTVGLTLRATNMRLTTYRAWPNMHDNRFALYKLPLQKPMDGKEYAGLWGGTFGWPPGKLSVDKPGKALFFLLLSYEEIEGHLLLIATKILEGTHYVLHPNGSAMFIVKVDERALDPFPWETDGDDVRVDIKHSYAGEGIANGYGFRYPGSKPGSLFEMQNGHLAFVWRESKAVLTLQRLDLEDLLKKGERVPALPPIANFAYLTKSYSNVFAGFPANSGCSPSPRKSFPKS